jgi:hypothetical protein
MSAGDEWLFALSDVRVVLEHSPCPKAIAARTLDFVLAVAANRN